ncbi:unnamed protein product [Victoria cruziana]
MLMDSIQALSNTVQTMDERQQLQQPQQPHNDVPISEAEVVPPLPPAVPVAPVEPVEFTGITPTIAQHKAFIGTKPPRFIGREGPDQAEEWLEEVEKAFEMMDTPTHLWI